MFNSVTGYVIYIYIYILKLRNKNNSDNISIYKIYQQSAKLSQPQTLLCAPLLLPCPAPASCNLVTKAVVFEYITCNVDLKLRLQKGREREREPIKIARLEFNSYVAMHIDDHNKSSICSCYRRIAPEKNFSFISPYAFSSYN